jgi:hypothetical protein
VKQILKYHKHTRDYWLQYSKKEIILSNFCDVDWGGNLNMRKSTTGFAFLFEQCHRHLVKPNNNPRWHYLPLMPSRWLRHKLVVKQFGYKGS